MNKAKKAAKPKLALTYGEPKCEQPGKQPVNDKLLAHIRAQLTILPTCSSHVVNQRVSEYLTAPTGNDVYMLDAWERCGRNDYNRHEPVKFQNVCKEVLTALGIACLIRYARGYLDEAEAAVAAIRHPD